MSAATIFQGASLLAALAIALLALRNVEARRKRNRLDGDEHEGS